MRGGDAPPLCPPRPDKSGNMWKQDGLCDGSQGQNVKPCRRSGGTRKRRQDPEQSSPGLPSSSLLNYHREDMCPETRYPEGRRQCFKKESPSRPAAQEATPLLSQIPPDVASEEEILQAKNTSGEFPTVSFAISFVQKKASSKAKFVPSTEREGSLSPQLQDKEVHTKHIFARNCPPSEDFNQQNSEDGAKTVLLFMGKVSAYLYSPISTSISPTIPVSAFGLHVIVVSLLHSISIISSCLKYNPSE